MSGSGGDLGSALDRRGFIQALTASIGAAAGCYTAQQGDQAQPALAAGGGGAAAAAGQIAGAIADSFDSFHTAGLPEDLPEPAELPAIAITVKGVYINTGSGWDESPFLRGTADSPLSGVFTAALNGADVSEASEGEVLRRGHEGDDLAFAPGVIGMNGTVIGFFVQESEPTDDEIPAYIDEPVWIQK